MDQDSPKLNYHMPLINSTGAKTKAGGNGLGLSIVKGFVEAHEGSVSASNARKKGGAVFYTVKIPMKEA